MVELEVEVEIVTNRQSIGKQHVGKRRLNAVPGDLEFLPQADMY